LRGLDTACTVLDSLGDGAASVGDLLGTLDRGAVCLLLRRLQVAHGVGDLLRARDGGPVLLRLSRLQRGHRVSDLGSRGGSLVARGDRLRGGLLVGLTKSLDSIADALEAGEQSSPGLGNHANTGRDRSQGCGGRGGSVSDRAKASQ